MTADTVPTAVRPRRASRVRWMLSAGVGAFCLLAWIAVAVVMTQGFDLKTCTAVAFVAALSLEAFFWTTAATLGVKAFEARRAIWRLITRGTWRVG
jgi:hypothetical protein